jgi:hypothetical protein
MTAPTRYPNVPQQQWTPLPYAPQIGDLWTENFHERTDVDYFLPAVAQSGQITTIAITANAPGDTLTVTIDGVPVIFTAGASANASALAGETAVEAIALLATILANGASVATNVLTLAFTDYEDHTIAVASSGATTLTPTTTAAVSDAKLLHGMWVAKRAPVGSFMRVMGEPSSISDQLAGVLFRIPGAGPDTATMAIALGMDADFLPVGRPYALATSGAGIVVGFVGDAPAPLDPVYRVCSGAGAGMWAKSDLSTSGTSEVVTLTLTTTATDTVAFNFDGLPDLTIASATGTEITDAATLYGLWVGNAAYAALGSIVDNLDGTLTITFADTTTHVFTDNSGGTSSIADAVDVPAVASTPALAVLCPDFSWGRPSIVGQPDEPDRAFLLLDPA